MKGRIREALQRARDGLDEALSIVEHEPAEHCLEGDEDLAEVRSRLAALETRVTVIESQREGDHGYG